MILKGYVSTAVGVALKLETGCVLLRHPFKVFLVATRLSCFLSVVRPFNASSFIHHRFISRTHLSHASLARISRTHLWRASLACISRTALSLATHTSNSVPFLDLPVVEQMDEQRPPPKHEPHKLPSTRVIGLPQASANPHE